MHKFLRNVKLKMDYGKVPCHWYSEKLQPRISVLTDLINSRGLIIEPYSIFWVPTRMDSDDLKVHMQWGSLCFTSPYFVVDHLVCWQSPAVGILKVNFDDPYGRSCRN